MKSPEARTAGAKFNQLLAIMARLRAPDGCPWDRDQTFDSIRPYTVEETYEVLEAIDARNWPELAEELGDFVLQAVFYAQMAEEAGYFRMEDTLDAINEKLIRRHPHIFGDETASTPEQVKEKWDAIKAREKKNKADGLLLDSVPRAMPALSEAAQINSRAARTGFDWPDVESVLTKLNEELDELSAARLESSADKIEGEIGDILFTVVNLARFLKVDPEQALRRTNRKFRSRFSHVERSLKAQGRTLDQSTLDEMESLWQAAKELE